ncbi:TonB-dependent receptor [Chitinimonas koreensis]|uniref:TonB-dependent receptor n=1 Tax=Chitinimonas koreensis TaxID=356302 RepID=UPI00041C6E78|nr:TonB-dependent receptor [Chitinimonas koreensis]
MRIQPTPIAAAVALALMSAALPGRAEEPPAAPPAKARPADTDAASPPKAAQAAEGTSIVVTGIRASREQSLNQKRNAGSVLEVITAEDLGKLPDKNVADAIQRVPGVNISSMAGGEGGFSENDRVSIRGTSPSLTQTLINGHSVGTGDWFVLSQTEAMGRSVSYALLPSEIVGRIKVHKSQTADLVEGGVSGAVDIETRRPLGFAKPFTAEVSLQAIHSTLPKKSDPQLNALFNWRSEAKDLGILVQLFSETRHERRDAQEFLGYDRIHAMVDDPDNPGRQIPNPLVAAHPDLADVLYPQLINSNLFTQKRVRQGGVVDLELKPFAGLTLDFNGFYSHMSATNYDHSYLAAPQQFIDAGIAPHRYTVRNGTLVAAEFPATADLPAGFADSMYRPGAASETWYADFNGKYKASDRLTLGGKLGTTRGLGSTPGDLGYESLLPASGLSYAMDGLSSPTRIGFPGADPADQRASSLLGVWYATVKAVDQERYGHLDADLKLDDGIWEAARFGLRYADHERQLHYPQNGGCGWGVAPDDPTACHGEIAWDGGRYPADYGRDFGGAGLLRDLWLIGPDAVEAYVRANASRTESYWPGQFSVREKTAAAYAMVDLAGEDWRGNVGLRLVQTRQKVQYNMPGGPAPVSSPNFGDFTPTVEAREYLDALPSGNFRFELSPTLVGRLAVARTMTRVDYSSLAGAITSIDNLTHSGTGGNAGLDPVRSTNYDASLEWYFAPKAMLSLGLFYMDLSSYVSYGTSTRMLANSSNHNAIEAYAITSPVNVAARNQGFELGWQQPLPGGFGLSANYTYTDGKDAQGGGLVGSSRDTWNLESYYENEAFSARLAYTWRSAFLVGLDRASTQYAAGVGNLAASLNYKLNDHFTLTFDALNLNNPTLKYYGDNRDQPRAFYSNGRQYFLGLRASL